MTQPLQPLRYGMTGCVAVVSLAMEGARLAWAGEPPRLDNPAENPGDWRASRFDLDETIHRLEAHAGGHGLGVLLRWVVNDGLAPSELPGRSRPTPPPRPRAVSQAPQAAVLVFEPLTGTGTPVALGRDAAAAQLPLSLRLRTGGDGRTEVGLPPLLASYRDALPPDAAAGLDELPALVAEALA